MRTSFRRLVAVAVLGVSTSLSPGVAAGVEAGTAVPCLGDSSANGELLRQSVAAQAESTATLVLAAACRYLLAEPLATVSGRLFIEGNGATIERDAAAAAFGIFSVASGGALSLNAVTVTGGRTRTGGGILNDGTLEVHGSTLTNNYAESGGGILNRGTLGVHGSTLTNNHAEFGGGIFNGGVANVTGTTLKRNSSAAGGAIYTFSGLTLAESTLSANSATVNGGGILTWGRMTVSNSTLSGNSAGNRGGAIRVTSGGFSGGTVSGSTVVGNTATLGGGIDIFDGSLVVANTIVAHNLGGNCMRAGGIFFSSPSNKNLSWPDPTCVGFAVADPMLGPLQDNGGPTETMLPGPGSAAIETGSAELCATTAQRGRPRFAPGTVDALAACDIGAVEVQPEDRAIQTRA